MRGGSKRTSGQGFLRGSACVRDRGVSIDRPHVTRRSCAAGAAIEPFRDRVECNRSRQGDARRRAKERPWGDGGTVQRREARVDHVAEEVRNQKASCYESFHIGGCSSERQLQPCAIDQDFTYRKNKISKHHPPTRHLLATSRGVTCQRHDSG